MADYINKNILSQAYIHVEPRNLETAERLAEFNKHIAAFARSRSNFYLYPEVSIEIEFEEGSLKTRITIFGTLALLMQGISNYPDFREGVSLLYSDSKRLAEYIVSEVQFYSKSKHEDVIQLEARTGVVGSLHKVISLIDQIKTGAGGTILAKDLVLKLEKVHEEIETLINNLKDPNDINLVRNGFSGMVREIPENPRPPKNKSNKPTAISTYQRRLHKLRKYLELSN